MINRLLLTFILVLGTIQAVVVVTPLWASDGWYLLVPPRSNYNKQANYLSGIIIYDKKPLSQWGQEGAYDSAAECEAAKSNWVNINQNVYTKLSDAYLRALGTVNDKLVLRSQREGVEMNNANVLALMSSRCIKSNDPRLKR